MQFPYPTAALTATPLRTSSLTPAMPTIPLRATYLPLRTAYLPLRIPIVPPAVPIIPLLAPTVPLAVIIVLLRAPTLPLSIPFAPLRTPFLMLAVPTTPLRTTLILFPRFIFTNSGHDIIIANIDIHISRPDFPTKQLSTSPETREKTKKVAITCEKGTFLMPFRTLSPLFCHFHPI